MLQQGLRLILRQIDFLPAVMVAHQRKGIGQHGLRFIRSCHLFDNIQLIFRHLHAVQSTAQIPFPLCIIVIRKDIIAEQNHQLGILIFQRLRQKSIADRGCLQCRRADIARKAMLLPHHHRRYPTQKRTAPDIQHIYRILRFTVKGMNFIGFIIMPHQQIRRIAKEHGENHHKCNTSYHNFQTLFPIHTQNPL